MTLPVSFEIRAAGPEGQPGLTIAQATWTLTYDWRELHLELSMPAWIKGYRQDFLHLVLKDYAPREHHRVGAQLAVRSHNVDIARIPDWVHPTGPDSLSIWPLDLHPEWRQGISRAWLVTHNLAEAPGAGIRRRMRELISA